MVWVDTQARSDQLVVKDGTAACALPVEVELNVCSL